MLQVRQWRTTSGSRAFALALIVGSLVALAGVGGYEIGSVTHGSPAATTQETIPQQGQPADPAPISGFQP
jgi:hypothetical protein